MLDMQIHIKILSGLTTSCNRKLETLETIFKDQICEIPNLIKFLFSKIQNT